MKRDTLDKANQLVELMEVQSQTIDTLKDINKYDKILIISSNHELYDAIFEQVADYEKRNPGNTRSIILSGAIQDYTLERALNVANESLMSTSKELEEL